MIQKHPHSSRQYMRITYKLRKLLIQLVIEKNLSIKYACKINNINYSTGKQILKKYRKLGYITKFSQQAQKILKESLQLQNPEQKQFQIQQKKCSKNIELQNNQLLNYDQSTFPIINIWSQPQNNFFMPYPTIYYSDGIFQGVSFYNMQQNRIFGFPNY